MDHADSCKRLRELMEGILGELIPSLVYLRTSQTTSNEGSVFFFLYFHLLEANTPVRLNENIEAMLTWCKCFSVLTLIFYFDDTVDMQLPCRDSAREALVYPESF